MKTKSGLAITFIAAGFLLFAGTARAGLLAYEGFDYDLGSWLTTEGKYFPDGGQNGGVGWENGWEGTSSTGVGRAMIEAGLSYTDLPDVGGTCYSSPRLGTERKFGQEVLDEWKTDNELWFSALVDPDPGKGGLTMRLFTTYGDGSIPWYYNRGIGFDLDISGSIVQASAGEARGFAKIADPTATNLILGKIETGGEVGDLIETTVTVWPNPVIADGEPTEGGSTVTANMGPAYAYNTGDYLGLHGSSSWGGAVDEFRMGTTFEDAVGFLVWDADVDMNWDDATANWSGATYSDGSNLAFNGAGQGTIDLAAPMAPGIVIVRDGSYDFVGEPIDATSALNLTNATMGLPGAVSAASASIDATSTLTFSFDGMADAETQDTLSAATVEVASGGQIALSWSGASRFGGAYDLITADDGGLSGDVAAAVVSDNSFSANYIASVEVAAGSDILRVTLTDLLSGDADADADVDSDDFNQLALNFDGPGTWSQGDFDGSGMIDSDDFNQLALNFGATVPAPAGVAEIPEPMTMTLLGLGGLILLGRRTR